MSASTVAKAVAPDPLRILENPASPSAKPNLRKPEIRTTRPKVARDLEALLVTGKMLRSAIRRADLTISEASGLLDVRDEAQFRRMLDGLELLGVHRLLTDKASPIWDELVALRAKRSGHSVQRVITIREA